MARFEQFEVWALNGDKWELVAAFPEFEVAAAVARNRGSRVRLLRAVYEDGKLMGSEVIAEVGSTRKNPDF
jgi:hypothetical protein